MLKDPAISVGVVGWLVRGAMDLARAVEYVIHARWSLVASLIRPFPLTGLGAAESRVNCSVIGVVAVASAFVFVASGLAVATFDLGGACLAGCVFAAG